jgi:hypothetical protein
LAGASFYFHAEPTKWSKIATSGCYIEKRRLKSESAQLSSDQREDLMQLNCARRVESGSGKPDLEKRSELAAFERAMSAGIVEVVPVRRCRKEADQGAL